MAWSPTNSGGPHAGAVHVAELDGILIKCRDQTAEAKPAGGQPLAMLNEVLTKKGRHEAGLSVSVA